MALLLNQYKDNYKWDMLKYLRTIERVKLNERKPLQVPPAIKKSNKIYIKYTFTRTQDISDSRWKKPGCIFHRKY